MGFRLSGQSIEKTQMRNEMTDQIVKTGLKVVVGRSWLGEFEDFLADERSGKTVEAYLRDLKHFCTWFERANGEIFGPSSLNTRDLRDYHTWCVDVEHSAPATWNRRRATLRVLCGWVERSLGMRPIAFESALKAEREQEQAPRWMEAQEERKLMRQVEINVNAAKTIQQRERAIRDQALVALMRFAGLRVEEAAEVQLADLQISERKGDVTVRGKRDKTRHVPLSSSAREALRLWLAVRGDMGPLLFGGMSARAIQKRVELLAEQTGIADLSCHVLRHTCAKSMVDAGRPLTEVQKILGHEKLETTARYVQPGREDLAEAVEAGELGKMRRK
jgi:site-specific recombinase XerD